MAPRGTSRRIMEELRDQICDGLLQPGQMLPPEAELADRYAVARGTVRAALAALLDEGLIEVAPGVGRRVVGGSGSDRSTAYGRIADDLAEQIRTGAIAPGAGLPSEAAVMQSYDVSRNTVRRAYKVLADSGVIVVRQGAGAFAHDGKSGRGQK